jgi:hypothetical protein
LDFFKVGLGKLNKTRIFKKDKNFSENGICTLRIATKKLYTPSFTAIQTINHPKNTVKAGVSALQVLVHLT